MALKDPLKNKQAGTPKLPTDEGAQGRFVLTDGVSITEEGMEAFRKYVQNKKIEKEDAEQKIIDERRKQAQKNRDMNIIEFIASKIKEDLNTQQLELLGRIVGTGELISLMKQYNSKNRNVTAQSECAVEVNLIQAIPSSPPDGEIYASRKDKIESAPLFIGRVYEKYLTGHFTRADLRRIDPTAEMALRNWERVHGRSDLNLPTVKERNDRQLLSEMRAGESSGLSARERMRLAAVAVRRSNPKLKT